MLLLDYLIKNGSERVIENAREHVYEVRSLESFRFVDENNKDQGINGMCALAYWPVSLDAHELLRRCAVRQKAKDLRALLQDDERIREERQKAKRNKGKFTGVSAAEMRSGGGSSSRYGGFESFGRSSNCMKSGRMHALQRGPNVMRALCAHLSDDAGGDSSRYGGFDKFGRGNGDETRSRCVRGHAGVGGRCRHLMTIPLDPI